MKNCALLCALLLSLCSLVRAQEIKIKEVYRKTITPDYTRYEYVFSITNNTPDRLNRLRRRQFIGRAEKGRRHPLP